MVMLEVGSPKAARELLCELQHLSYGDNALVTEYGHKLINDLIRQLDVHRPLGNDGKHGNLHTATCGCEDKRPIHSYITGHETEQVETQIWSDMSVSYRHRVYSHTFRDWEGWQPGRGD